MDTAYVREFTNPQNTQKSGLSSCELGPCLGGGLGGGNSNIFGIFTPTCRDGPI